MRLIYITAPDEKTASELSYMLVERGLAACVNRIPGMRSCYRWEGKIEESEEVILLVKTAASRVEEIIAAVKEAHPYDCPAILVLPVEGGYTPFLRWVIQESTA